jgi:hypothetical protein
MNSNAEITGPEGTPNIGDTGYGLSKSVYLLVVVERA